MEKQTTFIWWDGKQREITEFMSELGIDPDDINCSREAVMKQMGVSEEEPP